LIVLTQLHLITTHLQVVHASETRKPQLQPTSKWKPKPHIPTPKMIGTQTKAGGPGVSSAVLLAAVVLAEEGHNSQASKRVHLMRASAQISDCGAKEMEQ
jgi:hypothetical protein